MRLVEVMRKNILKILLVFVLVIGIFIKLPNFSLALDYENGHFQKINNDLSIQGCPVKLKDGRILILDIDKNYIFDPKTNTFGETTRTPFGFSYISNGKIFPAVVLNNGKVLIIGKILDAPSLKFQNELYEPIKKTLTQYEHKNNPKFSSLNAEKRNSIIDTHYKAYKQLSENEKEKLYLPIIAKDSNLLKQYNDYYELRKKSRHALLFNPLTGTYETIDKLSFNGNYSTLYTPVVKSNNEILIFSDQGEIYEYNFVNSKMYFWIIYKYGFSRF